MKKIKGALTTTERQVVKNQKTIVVLFIVLVISIVINVIFITGINDSIFKYRIVKVEESVETQESNGDGERLENDESSNEETTAEKTVVDENNDVENNEATDEKNEIVNKENEADEVSSESEDEEVDAIKSFEPESMLETLYSYDDDELKKALKENYDNAQSIKLDFKRIKDLVIKYDKDKYILYNYDDYVEFVANNIMCKYSKEKIEGLYKLIEKNELRVWSLYSYVNEKGMVIDLDRPSSYIDVSCDGYSDYICYLPDNMNEILEYCRELETIMHENK